MKQPTETPPLSGGAAAVLYYTAGLRTSRSDSSVDRWTVCSGFSTVLYGTKKHGTAQFKGKMVNVLCLVAFFSYLDHAKCFVHGLHSHMARVALTTSQGATYRSGGHTDGTVSGAVQGLSQGHFQMWIEMGYHTQKKVRLIGGILNGPQGSSTYLAEKTNLHKCL